MKERVGKASYYLGIAKQVAKRGTCIRRNFGAVIIKKDVFLSMGYSGAPRGTPNCIDIKKCLREQKGIASGKSYELCRGVHAELIL